MTFRYFLLPAAGHKGRLAPPFFFAFTEIINERLDGTEVSRPTY